MGPRRWLWVFNTEVTASPRIAFLLCSYGWPIGLRTSFGMLEGTAFNDVALSPSVILVSGSSLAVYLGSLDSLCSSSGISSSSAWAMGLI